MRAPVIMLAREIWWRNQKFAWLALGTVPCYLLFYLAVHSRIHERGTLAALSFFWMLFSLFWVVALFNYAENNPGKGWTGFPCRLFVLPVRTVVLVACPMGLAVAMMALASLAWLKLVFAPLGITMPAWMAAVLAVDVACFQAIVWSLAGFRVTRIIVLVLAGLVALVGEGCTFAVLSDRHELHAHLFWERLLILAFVLVYGGLAVCAFLGAWYSVAWQRRGGGRGRGWLKAQLRALVERTIDLLPKRTKPFSSPLAAQCWLEWRQGGVLLPVCVGCVLLLILGPVSWLNAAQMNPGRIFTTLLWILFLPLGLAFAIGKGFAKPDFWSMDLALKPFLAVRPLTAGEMVVAKMRVAALSSLITWLLVLTAIPLWIALWVDADTLKEISEWEAWNALLPYYSPLARYAIALLSLAAALIVTWRCLLGGLWVGLSGRWRYVVSSAALNGLVVVALVVALAQADGLSANEWQMILRATAWALAGAVVLKLWAGAFFWHKVSRQHLRPRLVTQCLLLWLVGTGCLVALAWLLGSYVLWLKYLFVLAALLGAPLARLAMGPLSLAQNRHR
jgi:hypothetical protein